MALRISFGGQLSDPSVARHDVERVLRENDYTGDVDAVLLVVSELVANAVMHASPPIAVLLELHAGSVRVSVEDADGHRLPEYRDPAKGARAGSGGYGLAIVDRLADDWGWAVGTNGGKSVWASMLGNAAP